MSAETTTIALVGRQNSGKTSALMHLTGTDQRPVNFPGTSVERQEATSIVDGRVLRWVDLPGLASLTTSSPDEEVAAAYLERGEAGVICAVLDASKLSVDLRLLADLMALGHRTLVALTKEDVALERGLRVDVEALEAALGVPVVSFHGHTGEGADQLARAVISDAPAISSPSWDPDTLANRVVTRAEEAPRVTRSERIDAVLLHPVWGLPIFAALLLGIFELLFVAADPLMGLIEDGQGVLSDLVVGWVATGALQSLLVDGIIAGVGAILVFLPQIVILVFFIAIMEGTGYMARVAFLLDRPLSKVGLSGRSFIPMFTSFACAVPGILATRMIPDERARIATIVTAPLMSCSARLPVYVLLLGAFFPPETAGLVLFGLYALGIVTAAFVAWILRRGVLSGGLGTLMMELPTYQRPVRRVVLSQVLGASRAFVVLAGTVIFAASMLIWLTSYYPRPTNIHAAHEAQRAAVTASGSAGDEARLAIDAQEASAYLEQSWLATSGKAVQPVFGLAGFDWRTTVGILAAFPARELVVPTLGILYSIGDVDPGVYDLDELDGAGEHRDGLRQALRESKRPDGSPVFSPLSALALMIFFALCSQCAATLAAIRRETRSWVWPTFTFVYMTAFAWIAAVGTFQIGTAMGFG
jgi:ferrous iron transport protein B